MIKKILVVAVIILLGVVAWFYFVSPPVAAGQYDEFAQCLSQKGVKMFGAYWCSHCKAQKESFGSSWRYVNYVECSLPGGSGQTDYCNQQGITGYPTWEFGVNDRVAGEMTFQQLAQKTNCALPRN